MIDRTNGGTKVRKTLLFSRYLPVFPLALRPLRTGAIMQLYTDVSSLRQAVTAHHRAGRSVGFVPTMGALHAGHMSLIEASRRENDVTICSIYVNPTQFNDVSDLEKYPRDLEADRGMLESAGCDGLFYPTDEIMYPSPTVISMSFGILESTLEGLHRPGHFQGVGLIVSKLFHLVMPDVAYFGQKDLQQFAVIRQMVEDLMFPVRLVRVPIMRETDGLAMSSRNARLAGEDRSRATLLFSCLIGAKEKLLSGESVESVKGFVESEFSGAPGVDLEYFAIVNTNTLQSLQQLDQQEPVSLCIAAWVGDVRLIDNLTLFE